MIGLYYSDTHLAQSVLTRGCLKAVGFVNIPKPFRCLRHETCPKHTSIDETHLNHVVILCLPAEMPRAGVGSMQV